MYGILFILFHCVKFLYIFFFLRCNRTTERTRKKIRWMLSNYHFELPFLDGHYYTKQIKKKITTFYFPRPFVSEIFFSMLFRSICYTQQKWKWANPKRSSRPTCCRIRFWAVRLYGCALKESFALVFMCCACVSLNVLCLCVVVYESCPWYERLLCD